VHFGLKVIQFKNIAIQFKNSVVRKTVQFMTLQFSSYYSTMQLTAVQLVKKKQVD